MLLMMMMTVFNLANDMMMMMIIHLSTDERSSSELSERERSLSPLHSHYDYYSLY
jgi:hypothetical protein